MREYEISKIERYYITAEDIDQAIEKVKDLDNSSAYAVDYSPTWAGPELAEVRA